MTRIKLNTDWYRNRLARDTINNELASCVWQRVARGDRPEDADAGVPPEPAHRPPPARSSTLLPAAPDFARAQGKFEASYGISVARIPIGSATAAAEFGDAHYLITMSGRASGMMRVLASGDGSAARATVLSPTDCPAPTEFTARTTTDDDTLE